MGEPRTRRRRRAPEAARAEILDAAARLFLERPPHEVSVRTIMAATTLARPSFYDHFDRRASLIMELVEPLMDLNRGVLERWPPAPEDPRAAARSVIEALITVWREHGALLAALADASRVDEDAAAAYRRFSEDSVTQVATRIRRELETGTVRGLDPEQTALALVLMNRAYITTQLFGPDPQPDEAIVDTLVAIWTRVLWPHR